MDNKQFFKRLSDGFDSLIKLDGQQVLKQGKVSQNIQIKENRLSKDNNSAIKESQYLEKLKNNQEIGTKDDIDRLFRDLVDTNFWNKLK